MNKARTVAVGIAATMALSATTAAAQGAASAEQHFQHCGGVTVDKSAPVISRASVFIKASPVKVWRMHTDIDNWSSWIPEITPAHRQTPGPLRPGSVFTWSPQGMKVTSTVKTVRPFDCTAWGAPVNGITGVHLWTFKPVWGGVVATTEESWAGAPVEADIPGSQAQLVTGLKQWVQRMKDTAEKAH